jgi:hypothetical protein
LYFGNHLLTNGYDHPYLGLIYDDGGITQGIRNLSLDGDTLLKKAALVMIAERSPSQLIGLYSHKIVSFLFFAKMNVLDITSSMRMLRFIEVLFAVAGLYFMRMRLVAIFLLACIIYQCVAHAPLLYTHRYSIGAIEIPLIILAATGLSGLFTLPFKKTGKKYALLVLGISCVLLVWIRFVAWSQRIELDISQLPHEQRLNMDETALLSASIVNNIDNDNDQVKGEQISIQISGYQPRFWSNHILSIFLRVNSDTRCDSAEILWSQNLVDVKKTNGWLVSIKKNNTYNWYHTGTLHPLNIKGDGVLTIKSDCAKGIAIKQLIISADNTVSYVLKKVVQ